MGEGCGMIKNVRARVRKLAGTPALHENNPFPRGKKPMGAGQKTSKGREGARNQPNGRREQLHA